MAANFTFDNSYEHSWEITRVSVFCLELFSSTVTLSKHYLLSECEQV